MSTQRQIEANCRNAQKSTGPSSVEGKAASRFNALKTGIDAKSNVIPGEDPITLEALASEYHARFRPSSPEQRFLVDSLIAAEWLARRLRKVEAQLWQHEMAEGVRLDRLNTKWPLGRLFSRNESDLTRLQRRIDSTDRLYHRALDKLERLQANPVSPEPLGVSEPELPAADPIPPQSAQEEPSVNQRPTPEFGFVPQPENPGSQPQPSGWGTPSASQPPGYYSSAVSSPPRRFAPLSPGGAVEKSPARERWEQSWDTQAPERGERTGRVAARVPRILQRQAGPHRPRVPDLSHRPLLEWSFTSPSDPS